MNSLTKLQELFGKFPGIGPRQAKRFVYFLLRKDQRYIDELSRAIIDIKKHVRICQKSFQYFYSESGEELSPIARDKNRDTTVLMVVERDSDLEAVERSGTYNGHYFVLGGTVPVLEKTPQKFIREKELLKIVDDKIKNEGLTEIILAMNATPESDHTAGYVNSLLKEKSIKISTLGRGLSTGTELEYSDSNTIKNALENRK